MLRTLKPAALLLLNAVYGQFVFNPSLTNTLLHYKVLIIFTW